MTSESDSALTGAAYDLANAGYVPMPDPQEKEDRDTIGSDNASLREAAAQCAEAPGEAIVRGYTGPDGKLVATNEAVTLARASRDYASATAMEKLIADAETSKVLAERVDTLRAEALANDPGAAERYGFELPGTQADDVATGVKEAGDREMPALTWRRPLWIPSLRARCNTRRCGTRSNNSLARPKRSGKRMSMASPRRRRLRR